MNTSFIHIVGVQGVGKTTLALDIVAGLARRGKSAIALMENDVRIVESPNSSTIETIRTLGLRGTYQRDFKQFDVVVAEHTTLAPDLVLAKGDLVIRMERAP